MRKLLLLFALLVPGAFAQATNAACPQATGATPHCVTLAWTPPSFGGGYNVYLGGTTSGNCASVTASTCTKIAPVAGLATTTFTVNSSATLTLAEGATYYFAVTTTNGTAESAPLEVKASAVPFLVPNPVSGLSATSH